LKLRLFFYHTNLYKKFKPRTGDIRGDVLRIFHTIAVALSNGDGGAIYLNGFSGIGSDAADGHGDEDEALAGEGARISCPVPWI
jgi:hypothetical protein